MTLVDCKHHWLIPTNYSPEVIASCKLCGKYRRMVNEWDKVIDDIIMEFGYLGGTKEILFRKLKNGVESAEEMEEIE